MLDRIASIVRAARQRENIELAELAADTHVPLVALTALEEGQPGVTTTQLSEIARALSLDVGPLLNGHEVRRPLPSVFLRHQPMQDFNHSDSKALDRALEQGRVLAELVSALSAPTGALQSEEFAYGESAADRPEAPAIDGYRLARRVRRWLKAASEPVGDMGPLLEKRFGVAVVVGALELSHATAASVRAGNTASVLLNSRDLQRAVNPLLARVHLAHELCHVLFDPPSGDLNIVIDVDADRRIQAAEQRARAFAAEFLLPLDGLVRLLGSPRGVEDMDSARELVKRARSHFGTSHAIAANHLCNLNFVHMRLRDWLDATESEFAGGLPETTLPVSGQPSRYVAELIKTASREGLVTDGEARSMLGLDTIAPLPWDLATA